MIRTLVTKTAGRLGSALRSPRAAAFRISARVGGDLPARLLTAWPRTFNEKVRYKMVRDRRPILGAFADKAEAKQYVESTVGLAFAPKTYVVTAHPEQLEAGSLPLRCAIKTTHSSGGAVLVSPDFDRGGRVPLFSGFFERVRVHPEELDMPRLIELLTAWLELQYGADQGEWAYSLVRPRVIVEEYLEGKGGLPPADVKFFVMNGRCIMFRVDSPVEAPDGRLTKTLNHYWANGTPIGVRFREYHGEWFDTLSPPPSPPTQLKEMVRVAEVLAKPVDFLRVDMFVLHDRFVVGELTNYPTNGTGAFAPKAFDVELGRHWRPTGYR